MKLSHEHEELYQRAVAVCREFDKQAWRVIEILQELDRAKLYKSFDCSSLFVFAVDHLKLDNALAYQMITAARKSSEIPELAESLKHRRLSVAKAARMFSTLTVENAAELVPFAETHTADEINREVSRIRKREGLPEKLRSVKVTEDVYAKIKRAQAVLTKSGRRKKVDPNAALAQALDEFLERHDPVKKAKRAVERKEKKSTAESRSDRVPDSANADDRSTAMTDGDAKLCTYRVSGRKPLTADQNHAVFARDGGQCTHRDAQGRRCTNDRFLHVHHIRPVSQGGGNEPENLTTLCSFHHDLTHQLTFPIEGQITWLRDLRVAYGVGPRRTPATN